MNIRIVTDTLSHSPAVLISVYLHRLSECGLTSRCCSALSSALSAPHSPLTELQLDDNQLGDSGVTELCEGLRSTNCKLEKLCLRLCELTSGCCSALSSGLTAGHSRLTELDLSENKLGDSGVSELCRDLRDPNCRLEKLSLDSCHLTSGCCSAVYLALSAPHSPLTELNLRNSELWDSGVTELCEGLRSENFFLMNITLYTITHSQSRSLSLLFPSLYPHSLPLCELTSGCCSALSSALSAPHSPLTELNLSDNRLEDSGVSELCEGLRSENCKLEKLRTVGSPEMFICCFYFLFLFLSQIHQNFSCRSLLSHCSLTSGCCSALSSLDLCINELGDSGVSELCGGLRNPNCKLKKPDFNVIILSDLLISFNLL
uniref:Uncharacterized protein n=1 Tax=Erpetoichthys calabaricus TaxID=27687 RepID=A0A8C4RE44_ERPCA